MGGWKWVQAGLCKGILVGLERGPGRAGRRSRLGWREGWGPDRA